MIISLPRIPFSLFPPLDRLNQNCEHEKRFLEFQKEHDDLDSQDTGQHHDERKDKKHKELAWNSIQKSQKRKTQLFYRAPGPDLNLLINGKQEQKMQILEESFCQEIYRQTQTLKFQMKSHFKTTMNFCCGVKKPQLREEGCNCIEKGSRHRVSLLFLTIHLGYILFVGTIPKILSPRDFNETRSKSNNMDNMENESSNKKYLVFWKNMRDLKKIPSWLSNVLNCPNVLRVYFPNPNPFFFDDSISDFGKFCQEHHVSLYLFCEIVNALKHNSIWLKQWNFVSNLFKPQHKHQKKSKNDDVNLNPLENLKSKEKILQYQLTIGCHIINWYLNGVTFYPIEFLSHIENSKLSAFRAQIQAYYSKSQFFSFVK